MRIVDIKERSVPISRYADPSIPSGGLTTSIVAVTTDAYQDGAQVVGFGFTSVGRFSQSGLVRERFAPRLLACSNQDLISEDGANIDPFRAWSVMMAGEKPGGHGERSVAVGALDMAVWDAAAKIAGKPLYRLLGEVTGISSGTSAVPTYASGGYLYPTDDINRLRDEIQQYLDGGFTHVKIKIGSLPLGDDLKRIETALDLLPDGSHLAVDAANSYRGKASVEAAMALAPYHLRWCDHFWKQPKFEIHAECAKIYPFPLCTGEALFSAADAKNLILYGGLRPNHDVLLFDPAHCYGLSEFLRIIALFEASGWSRKDFQPHGGHLYGLHVAAALSLGGCEANPKIFQPFGGFADDARIEAGMTRPPDAPGFGFETRTSLMTLFQSLMAG